MFMTLSRGACLLIVADEVKSAPRHLANVIHKHHVTVMQAGHLATTTVLTHSGVLITMLAVSVSGHTSFVYPFQSKLHN